MRRLVDEAGFVAGLHLQRENRYSAVWGNVQKPQKMLFGGKSALVEEKRVPQRRVATLLSPDVQAADHLLSNSRATGRDGARRNESYLRKIS